MSIESSLSPSTEQTLAGRYAGLWRAGDEPPDVFAFLAEQPATTQQRAEVLLRDQYHRWMIGRGLPAEEYLSRCPDVAGDADLVIDLVVEEFGYRLQSGAPPRLEEFVERFPSIGDTLRQFLCEGPPTSSSETVEDDAPADAPTLAQSSQPVGDSTICIEPAGFLAENDVFSSLPPGVVSLIEAHMESIEFTPRERLMRQGEQADSLMVICSGAVEVSTVDEAGRRHLIARVGRGSVIGEMALLTDEPRSADVMALTRVRSLVLPKDTFLRLAEEYPSIAVVLTRLIAARLGRGERDVLAGKIFGGYRIGRRLGRGGMAIVYEGEEIATGRRAALKMMSHRLVYDRAALAQFQREAEIIAAFDHECIVGVYGRFDAFRTYFIAMRFCEGENLSQRIKRLGPLPAEEVKSVAAQLASALAYAHGKGVIHRDLKPANVMLAEDGRVMLMDFGLARPLEETDPNLSGLIVGTPPFMSPEQLAGRSLGPASDYFSLGCLLYEMMAGERLFAPKSVSEMRRLHRQWKGLPRGALPRRTDRDLRKLLKLCLHREAEKRRIDLAAVAAWPRAAVTPLVE